MMGITNEMLDALRTEIERTLSPRRAAHVLGVEKMAQMLGVLFFDRDSDLHLLRGAALLHDLTKELPAEEHARILRAYGTEPSEIDMLSPKTLHARTAALLIPDRYPDLAIPELISAVRWHTTGRANMTVYEKLIYFADYIDETRTYPDCVRLRSLFFDARPESMDMQQRCEHLDRLIVLSFDMTLDELIKNHNIISRDTIEARNYLLCALNGRKTTKGNADR